MRRPGTDQTADPDVITIRLPRGLVAWILGLAVGVLVALVLARATADDWTQQGGVPAPLAPPAPSGADISGVDRPARGPDDAAVTIVEFTDYQCPFCRRHFTETYRALLHEYEGRIRYVVRNFPIASIHPLATKAAEAAECAHDQGRFWDYRDALFQNPALDIENLKRHATALGLDRRRFDQCLDGGAKTAVVDEDIATGRRHGVSVTPVFFINGERLVGAKPLPVFRSMVDEELGHE